MNLKNIVTKNMHNFMDSHHQVELKKLKDDAIKILSGEIDSQIDVINKSSRINASEYASSINELRCHLIEDLKTADNYNIDQLESYACLKKLAELIEKINSSALGIAQKILFIDSFSKYKSTNYQQRVASMIKASISFIMAPVIGFLAGALIGALATSFTGPAAVIGAFAGGLIGTKLSITGYGLAGMVSVCLYKGIDYKLFNKLTPNRISIFDRRSDLALAVVTESNAYINTL